MRLSSARFTIGVRARLFGALALTGMLALMIGLAAYAAFDGLHAGITSLTGERFPAVVASARLERQHQRIMRTLEQLAAAADNLERETVAQGLDDQLAGYERLLRELPNADDKAAQQIGHLRAQYDEIVRLRDAIDVQTAVRVAAARGLQEQTRAAAKIAEALDDGGLSEYPDDAVQRWLAQAQRLLFLAASAHRVESRFAVARLATAARDGLRRLEEAGGAVPASARTLTAGRTAALAALTEGGNSIFAKRLAQLEAGESQRGLLERVNQVSLLITGLTTGIFVEQTNLAEESRNRLIAVSEVYTKLFFGATLVVALVAALALAYVQRSIVARLWAARDALRRRAEGGGDLIPTAGPSGDKDEISELAQALNFYVRETEEKSEAIRRNERWLRATLEAAPTPLVISGRDDGRVRFVNRRAVELLKISDAQSFLDRPASSIWRSSIVRDGFVHEIVKYGVAGDIEAELITDAGKVFWGLVSGVVIEFEGEKVLLVALVDITRRRLAESLNRRAQEELRRAKERAEKADAAKTEFLATLSHEMRTPLNGILGLGRLLLTHGLEPAERRHVRSIMRCGGALLDQVNDILDLRRIEDGKLDLDPVACPLGPFFDDVLATVEPMAEEKGVGLAIHLAEDLPAAVMVDPQRLRQILINLTGNAVKFTDKGGVRVAATRESRGEQNFVKIDVQDTGIGIPPERWAAIFEKLEQGDPSISRRFGGSGLGLAIARHLAHAMGGEIEVESEPGVGSVFTLRIPLVAADAAAEDVVAASVDPDEPSPPLCLLLVEDDRVNREVALGLLGAAGHRVTVAETGERAVALAAAGDFDAVLLDIRLPDIDGVEAARRIRALDDAKRAAVPVVAVTANVFAADRERYLAAGIDAVVEKPIFPERLTRTLAALAGRRGEALMPADGGALIPHEEESEERQAERPPLSDAALNEAVLNEAVLARYYAALGAQRFGSIRGLLQEAAADGLPRLTAVGDLAEVRETAHRLAGAGSHFGLTAFVALMQRIEDLAKDGQAEAAALAGAAAPAVFAAALAAMDDWLFKRTAVEVASSAPGV